VEKAMETIKLALAVALICAVADAVITGIWAIATRPKWDRLKDAISYGLAMCGLMGSFVIAVRLGPAIGISEWLSFPVLFLLAWMLSEKFNQ
jgi:hypothetical protein